MKAYPKTRFQKTLTSLGACGDARKWVGTKTLAEAWAKCRRAEWMMWLAERAGVADDARDALRASELCSCSGCLLFSKTASPAIRKAVPLSVIRAGLK